MPIHEYKCKKCSNQYEVFYVSQSAVKEEEKLEKCPKCNSKSKTRQFARSTGHILKGKGWARDGY